MNDILLKMKKGRPKTAPSNAFQLLLVAVECSAPMRSPQIDGDEEEEPHDVNKVPIPSGKFKTEMLLRREMSPRSAQQTDRQKDRTDDHMEPVKARRHEQGCAVDVAPE